MSKQSQFITLLKQHRERAGLTQTAMARAAGVHQSYMWLVEHGARKPTMDCVAKIIKVLELGGVEAEQLHTLALELRANKEGRELAHKARKGDGMVEGVFPEGTLAIRWVRIIRQDTVDINAYQGDAMGREWIAVPESLVVDEASAVAVRVEGDGMLPRYRSGDIVVIAPLKQPKSGKPAAVQTGGDIIVGLWHTQGSDVVLRFLNPDFPAVRIARAAVNWAHPTIGAWRAD